MNMGIIFRVAFNVHGPEFCFIFAPDGYDEPETHSSEKPSMGLTAAYGKHAELLPILKSKGCAENSSTELIRNLKVKDGNKVH